MAKHKVIPAARRRNSRTSPRQIAANRANARRSTGPRTPEGKQRSSLNALKHGILAMRAVNRKLDGEEQFERYRLHRDNYFECLRPEDQVQADLVELIAANRWRMAKLLEFEDAEAWRPLDRLVARVTSRCDEPETQEELEFETLSEAGLDHTMLPDEYDSARILRYRASLNSEYFRAMAELRRLKKDSAAAANADDGGDTLAAPAENSCGEAVSGKRDYQTNPIAENQPENQGFSRTEEGGDACGSSVEPASARCRVAPEGAGKPQNTD